MSLKTKNHKLFKYEDNDIADLRFLHDSMDKIDKGLVLNLGQAKLYSNGIRYDITTNDISDIANCDPGTRITFIPDSTSTGTNVWVNINGKTSYKILKPNGNDISKLYANVPYTIGWNGANFTLASSDDSDQTTVGTTGDNVLKPQTFIGSDGEIHTGTIETMKTNAYNNNKTVGHHDALAVTYGALSYDSAGNQASTKYLYLQMEPKQYSGINQFVRSPESAVGKKLSIPSLAAKILNDTTILGTKGTLAKKTGTVASTGVSQSGDKAVVKFPAGGYVDSTPQISVNVSDLVNNISSITNIATGTATATVEGNLMKVDLSSQLTFAPKYVIFIYNNMVTSVTYFDGTNSNHTFIYNSQSATHAGTTGSYTFDYFKEATGTNKYKCYTGCKDQIYSVTSKTWVAIG